MNLLVAGSARVDAGKTTFSTGLLERVGGVGFKPRAGNDYWFDHGDYRAAVEDGRLYGKDARRLAAASADDARPEARNPVHRLWRPSPGGGSGLLGQSGREFLVDRVGEQFVVNGTAELPDDATEHLPLDDAAVVRSLEGFNDVMDRLHLPAIRSLTEQVRGTDRAVVESYADVAVPLATVDYDAVAVVEPRRARVYGGDRFEKALEVAGTSARDGQLETSVGDVTDLLDPVATTELPALAPDEQSDPAAVADAYEVAYDALIGAAVE